MGRARSLPAALEYIHPRFRTPVNAILLQTFITLTIGIAIGFWIGPDQEYYFLGVTMTLTLIFIYSAGNVGVFFLYRRERRAEFSPVLHFLFPRFPRSPCYGLPIIPWCLCRTGRFATRPFWWGPGCLPACWCC